MRTKYRLIKYICIILSLIIISASYAENTTTNIEWPYYNGELQSEAAIVLDADSSVVLFGHNVDKKHYPASLAKIMTAIIVFDKINGNYDELVTFSYNAVTKDIDRNSVTIGASAGDQLSVKDCLYSLLLPSANDAANALAEHIAGSVNDFVLLMNEKVANLGLKNTHFVNPSGLHDDNQYTTAYDMAKILQYAIKNYPMFLQISSSVSYTHAPIRKYKNPNNSNNQVLNTNSLMVPGSGFYYNGITSGKTGHTSLAGYNLASSAKRNGMHLICVTLGSRSEKHRFDDARNLYDFHFANYKSIDIKEHDKRFKGNINTLSINDVALIKTLNITCNDDSHITLPKTVDESLVKSKIVYQVKDIYNKYAIGSITYTLNDKIVGECTLEGRDMGIPESIFTGHLDLSAPLTNNKQNYNDNKDSNPTNTNALIYRNSKGHLVISSTLITVLIITLSLIILIGIVTFIYTKIITNSNSKLTKTLFKIRRRFHHH